VQTNPAGELPERLRALGTNLASAAIDCAFLVLWLALQAGVHSLVTRFPVVGLEAVLLTAFQVIFATSTLVPVAIYVLVDMIRMGVRAYRAAREEPRGPPPRDRA
jgi:uncharacterized membrane protein